MASAGKNRWSEMKIMLYPVALYAALWGVILGAGFFLDDKALWTREQLFHAFHFTRPLFADCELGGIVLDCDDNIVEITYPGAFYEELVRYFEDGPWKKAPGEGCTVYLQEGCRVVLDRGTMLIKSEPVGVKRPENRRRNGE